MTYAAAGVSLDAADEVVRRLRPIAASATRPEVLGGLGGFGGLFSLSARAGGDPVLVASTDGVGTKLLVAREADRLETVGIDLVAMCVDDLVCAGAEPLFLLDYVAMGRLDPQLVARVVSGVAEGCRQAGCALLGGETAEHPDAMAPGDLDLAGFAVGLVERDRLLGAHRVRAGDVLVGLPSPGLRSNGYSLARRVLMGDDQRRLEEPAWPGADHSLLEELLKPSLIYAPTVLAAIRAQAAQDSDGVHACAHITGGGIPGNLCRVLPPDLDAHLDRSSWKIPRIFEEIATVGGVADDEMYRVFNLGLGMVLVVGGGSLSTVLAAMQGGDVEPLVVGEVVPGRGEVVLR